MRSNLTIPSTALQGQQQRPSSFKSAGAAGFQWLSLRTSLLVAIGIALADWSSVVAQDLQCPDGHVIMEFVEMAPEIYDGFSAFNFSVTSAAYAEDNFDYFQARPDTPTSFEAFCVPADQCLTVSIHVKELNSGTDFPPFSIIYNSTTHTLHGPFPSKLYVKSGLFDYHVQVGASCEVTCDKDHVLLEIEAMTGEASGYDWQLIDRLTNEVVQACLPPATPADSNAFYNNTCYWSSDGWFRDRVCVPKDGCYLLVAGENSYSNFLATLQVTFGGEIVLQTNSFHFESLHLPHPESADTCSSNITNVCQGAAYPFPEAMKIFIFHSSVVYEDTPSLTWKADFIVSGQVISDQGTLFPGDRPLRYNQICMPGCASIYVSGTDNATVYEVQVEGVIYVQAVSGIDFVVEGDEPLSDSKRSHMVGSLCRSHDCEGPGQSLVEVDIRYAPELRHNSRETGVINANRWQLVDIPNFKEEEPPEPAISTSLVLGFGFPYRQPGKLYRNQFCLSDKHVEKGSNNGRCAALNVFLGENSMAESYSVSVNGEFFSDRIDCSKEVPMFCVFLCNWVYGYYRPILSDDTPVPIMTPLNGNCKMMAFSDYIAVGFMMVALLSLCCLFCVFGCEMMRRDDASPAGADVDGKSPGTDVEEVMVHSTNPAIAMNEPVAIPIPNRKYPTNPVLLLEGQALPHEPDPPTVVGIETSQVQRSAPQAQADEAAGEEDFA